MFALLVLAAADFLVVLDGLIVSVALPSIQRDLGFTQADLQWVVNAYLLAFGGFLLLGGRAADLVGRRRVFIAGLASAQVLGLLAAAVALLAGFVSVERRSRAPLVRFAVFRVPGLAVANLAGAALPVGLGALLFVGTLYLQQVLGYGALQTGLAYLALSVPVVLGSPIAARLVDRFGHKLVAFVGFVVQAAGVALLVTISADGGFVPAVLASFVLVGIAAPVAFVPVTSVAVGGVEEAGLAAGLFNTSQQVGNAIVIAVLATVAAARTSALLTQNIGRPEALTGGFRAAFVVAACFLVLGAVAAWTLPAQQSKSQGSPQGEARTRGLDMT